MYCPSWIYDVAVCSAAKEFLESELSLSAFAKKYSDGLGDRYAPRPPEQIESEATNILQFLAEINASEAAVEFLNDFTYYRFHFEGVGKPRKLKPLFGSLEDPVKEQEIRTGALLKSFKAYVFGTRSNTVPVRPVGWSLEGEESSVLLAELASVKLTMIDVL